MTLVKYNPLKKLTDVDSAIDRFFKSEFPSFGDFFGNNFFSEGAYPRVDIRDYKDKAMIIAEVPGIEKEDIKLDYKDGMLSIQGNKRKHKESSDERYDIIVKEIKYSSFCRKISIPEKDYDIDNIKAKHEGVNLEIIIPKKQEKMLDKSSTIPIE
jgi:HSP20 family protein